MTTPAGGTNPGQTTAPTPTAGGALPYAASGAAGDGEVEAPDNVYSSVHRPGMTPGANVDGGYASMKVVRSKSSDKKK